MTSQMAHGYFLELAQKNIHRLRGVLDQNHLEDICLSPKNVNKQEIPKHFAHILTLIKNDSDLLGVDIDENLVRTLQSLSAR